MAEKLHVLLVEDELSVRSLLRQVLNLSHAGRLEIHEAGTLPEAKKKLEELPTLHIAFLDTDFPGGTRPGVRAGIELFEHLKARHPNASVVAMSGMGVTEWEGRDVQEKLEKPFSMSRVTEAVRRHGFERHGIPHE